MTADVPGVEVAAAPTPRRPRTDWQAVVAWCMEHPNRIRAVIGAQGGRVTYLRHRYPEVHTWSDADGVYMRYEPDAARPNEG